MSNLEQSEKSYDDSLSYLEPYLEDFRYIASTGAEVTLEMLLFLENCPNKKAKKMIPQVRKMFQSWVNRMEKYKIKDIDKLLLKYQDSFIQRLKK